MRTTLTTLVVTFALLASAGCRRDRDATSDPARGDASPSAARAPATQPTTFTGTLRGGAVAIGGETTGWRLEGDAQTGGIELDVSKVRDRARQLDGKRVKVTGRMTARSGPERGTIQVLVADKIEPAPQPAK